MAGCTRCDGTGFLNIEQVDDETLSVFDHSGDPQIIIDWMWGAGEHDHDVSVCDCCGDGVIWYGTPGQHYTEKDPPGPGGPYAYNGGHCECH